MDTRGQGSTWSVGDTADPDDGAPAHPGFMTRGILDPDTYYYRRVFTDAVRAVEAVRSHPAVDATRVAVTGGSQGGGIAIAAAALVPDLAGAAPDVPFLCDFPRATTIVDTRPYVEIVRLPQVAPRPRGPGRTGRCPTSTARSFAPGPPRRASSPSALMDQTCPPSTVYAAYNRCAGAEAHRGVPLQRPRGRPGLPRPGQAALAGRAPPRLISGRYLPVPRVKPLSMTR